jgi:hypothetical protein
MQCRPVLLGRRLFFAAAILRGGYSPRQPRCVRLEREREQRRLDQQWKHQTAESRSGSGRYVLLRSTLLWVKIVPDQISVCLPEKRKRPKLSLSNGTSVEQPSPESALIYLNRPAHGCEWHEQATRGIRVRPSRRCSPARGADRRALLSACLENSPVPSCLRFLGR